MKEVTFHDINIKDHHITIWANQFIILRHPEKCDLYEESMLDYLQSEGYIDPNKCNCLVVDSYIDFEP
jgi:hypothetical protein